MATSTLPPIPPYTLEPLPRERVVRNLVFPVLGAHRWRPSYNEVWGRHRHMGCDIAAPKRTPIVAPLSGRIGFKVQTFWIVDDDGWGCLGTHLNDDRRGTRDTMFAPQLLPGDHVQAGQLIGYVGDSGDATGCHLHLELHGPDGMRDPGPSLQRARRLAAPLSLLTPSPHPGLRRLDGCPRGFDASRHRLRVILVGEEKQPGHITMAGKPEWRSLTLTPEALHDLSGPDRLREASPYRALRLYCQGERVVRAEALPPVAPAPPPRPAPRLDPGLNRLHWDPLLTRNAVEELDVFNGMAIRQWIRTGNMALGPLRMRGTQLHQAAILALSAPVAALTQQPLVQQALRHPAFTRFGLAQHDERTVLVLADP